MNLTRRTHSLQSNRGMTLIEIVIVVVIIAFIATMGIPKLGGAKTEMQGAVRKLGILIREVKRTAKLNRATYRLAIEMSDPDALEKKSSRYWVEKTPGSVLMSEDDEEAEFEAIKNQKLEDLEPSKFQLDGRLTKEPVELPRGLRFSKVEVASRRAPTTIGVAYIYFLPEGYVEQSVIQLRSGEKLHWTLALAPITGKVDVYGKEVSLSELQR